MSGQSLANGAIVLLLSGVLNKLMGFIYGIFIIRLILPEGVGLFNMVYPIYVLLLVAASAGIPAAIAKLVAEEAAHNNLPGAYRVFKICLYALIASSALITVLCCYGAPLLLKYVFINEKMYYSFLCLIPGIVIVPLCSAFRGFFQGLQQMTPTAVTQSLEQLLRCVSGLFFASLLRPQGVAYAAAGVSLGVIIGELAGFCAMLFIYAHRRPRAPVGAGHNQALPVAAIAARTVNLAAPVTLTRFVATFFLFIDSVLIPQRLLVNGLALAEATAVYGQFVGICQSLLFSPAVITMSLATVLLPAISGAQALHHRQLVRTRCETAVRLTLIAGIPWAVIFMMLPEELCGYIFGYPQAGASLGILALGGPFLYLTQTCTGILQGLGQASRPFRNLLIASLLKIAGIYYLTGMPLLGIKGTAAALAVSYVVMAWLNLADVCRYTGWSPQYQTIFLKPLIAAAAMCPAIHWSQHYWLAGTGSGLLAVAGAIFNGLAVYLLLLILNGGISRQDWQRIKAGNPFAH